MKKPKNQLFYKSNGKLLLTSEYAILFGAKGICLPLNLGQSLNFNYNSNYISNQIILDWRQIYNDKIIFYTKLELPEFKTISTNSKEKNYTLIKILKIALSYTLDKKIDFIDLKTEDYYHIIKQLSDKQILKYGKIHCDSNLDFNPIWGFGTSSTLICNLSKWLDIDPYELNKKIFKGSGYDIACCDMNLPFIYQKSNIIKKKRLKWNFVDKLFIVHLNKKVNTFNEIKYLKKNNFSQNIISKLNFITDKLFNDFISYIDFCRYIDEHENIISSIINKQKIKNQQFNDFQGSIKSLGTWGGDCILATSKNTDYLLDYFKTRKYLTIFKFNELVKI